MTVQEKIYQYVKEEKYQGLKRAEVDLGLSRATIHKHLHLLVAKGLIQRQSPYRVIINQEGK
jgi:predicted ArsR family transcriptional regulator